jgi:hypothetical protein
MEKERNTVQEERKETYQTIFERVTKAGTRIITKIFRKPDLNKAKEEMPIEENNGAGKNNAVGSNDNARVLLLPLDKIKQANKWLEEKMEKGEVKIGSLNRSNNAGVQIELCKLLKVKMNMFPVVVRALEEIDRLTHSNAHKDLWGYAYVYSYKRRPGYLIPLKADGDGKPIV